MGLTMDHRTALELLGAHALDALEPAEADAVDAHLATCAACAGTLALLRGTAAELAALTPAPPPDHLRHEVLALAASRAQRPVEDRGDPLDVHGIEADRLARLLTSLVDDAWTTDAGPAFPDWTVHDLAAHLAATETLLAAQLGVDGLTPDRATAAEARAHEAVARHRRLEPAAAVAEFVAAATAVTRAASIALIGGPPLVQWAGTELPLDVALTHRAFEIWTHADDIRTALGRDRAAPPPASLTTMSRTVLDGLPLMMAVAEADHPGRVVELRLTGAGGGTYTLVLGLDGGVVPLSDAPDAHLEIDVVDFCRAIADRADPSGVTYRTTGDSRLGADLVRSLPVLAVL
jgi:uncharacterized protein (TIGR03083 family)